MRLKGFKPGYYRILEGYNFLYRPLYIWPLKVRGQLEAIVAVLPNLGYPNSRKWKTLFQAGLVY